MRSVAITLCAVTALALPVAPVNADQDGCPPPFDPLTEAEQYALAERNGVPADEVAATLTLLDRNADRTLCFLFLPADFPNVIDNRVAAR